MNGGEVLDALTAIARDIFADDSIVLSLNSTADDIPDWDSVNHITLVVSIEQHFHIKFNSAELDGMKNIGEMVTVVKDKLKKR
jgi:acyl carrier protein